VDSAASKERKVIRGHVRLPSHLVSTGDIFSGVKRLKCETNDHEVTK